MLLRKTKRKIQGWQRDKLKMESLSTLPLVSETHFPYIAFPDLDLHESGTPSFLVTHVHTSASLIHVLCQLASPGINHY